MIERTLTAVALLLPAASSPFRGIEHPELLDPHGLQPVDLSRPAGSAPEHGRRQQRHPDAIGLDSVSISAVPLPPSVLLLLAGLGGVAAVARRR